MATLLIIFHVIATETHYILKWANNSSFRSFDARSIGLKRKRIKLHFHVNQTNVTENLAKNK